MNTTITTEFTFDCAHRLDGYKGDCSNLHGHTYKLQVDIARQTASRDGMVVDFKEIKAFIKRYLQKTFDHTTLLWIQAPKDKFIGRLFRQLGLDVCWLKYRPTAENIAADIFTTLNAHLREQRKPYSIKKVRLWETPTSYAEVSDD